MDENRYLLPIHTGYLNVNAYYMDENRYLPIHSVYLNVNAYYMNEKLQVMREINGFLLLHELYVVAWSIFLSYLSVTVKTKRDRAPFTWILFI